METPREIIHRWRYLRDLLIDQLGRLETGALTIHTPDANVSPAAIAKLKQHILDFDQMIARMEARTP
jgi:hypothetical protein